MNKISAKTWTETDYWKESVNALTWMLISAGRATPKKVVNVHTF